MPVYLIETKENRPKAAWEGGTTSDLFVYPSGSETSKKNFGLRVSLAKISSPHSRFSNFTGFKRTLALLTGSIELSNEIEVVSITAGSKFEFDGGTIFDCELHSESAIALNIIYKEPSRFYVSDIQAIDDSELTLERNYPSVIIYCVTGEANLKVSTSEILILRSGDSLRIENFASPPIRFEGQASLIYVLFDPR